MKKSVIFIFVLLAIIAAETWALFHHSRHPSPVEYAFDEQEYDLPPPNLQGIKPFLFETQWADEIGATLDELQAVVEGSFQDLSEQSSNNPPVIENKDERTPQKGEPLSFTETKIKTPDPVKPAEVLQNTDVATSESRSFAAEAKALVAVVIDDVGLSIPFTNQIAQIEKPVTVAFLPYGASNKNQVMKLKNAGFEVILHTPMMPHVQASLAPNTLSPEMEYDDLQNRFNAMLDRFAGTGMYGINNHMGSKFTESKKAMTAIVEVLKQKNMFFLDSKTSSKSVARSVCRTYNVPYISRDIFLDNEKDYDKIMQQFAATERVAKKRGYAVAIGHPYPQTLRALKDWEKNLDAHNIKLVPLSYLLQRIN